MITFFRQIRKKLADDNQLFKYSRYAIGEIVLVVIGILIALQINNWNEDRIRDSEISLYMDNLVDDLNADIKSLSIWGNIHNFRYNALQHVLVLSGHDPAPPGYSFILPKLDGFNPWEKDIPKEFDAEFVITAFQYSLSFGNMKPNLSTLEELHSTGLYSYIKNAELKTSINEYYNEYERRLGQLEHDNAKKFRDDWLDSLSEQGYNHENIDDLKGSLDWIENNPQARARLKSLIYNAKWRYVSSDSLINTAQRLIDFIENQDSSNSE